MRKPHDGVRVLEVAQFTYVPSAGAVLADWGAEVIKIEHPVTGDAQRGLVKVLGAAATKPGSTFAPIMEAPNRGKRSVGMALDNADVRPEFDELIRRSDVFLTNYLPSARTKLHINVADVRKVNPDIMYVAGSGFGMKGP
ncbi:CoA transferase, partial [Mycobacterium avium]